MVNTTAIALLVIGLVVGGAVGYGASLAAGTTSSGTQTIYIGSIEPLSGGDAVVTLFQVQISNIYVISIVLAIVVSFLLAIFFNFTHLGKSMRAIANNFDLARISGIDVSFAVNAMWIIAGGLGGLGGVILGTYTTVTPALGFTELLDIFAVVIIAGLTSFVGTIIGGYLVGFSTNTVIEALNYYFGVPLGYAPLLPFAMIVVVLLFKPTGLAPDSQKGIALLKRVIGKRGAKRPEIKSGD